jgi:hypothetical protein
MTKRPPIDGTEEQARIAAGVGKEIQPPFPLHDTASRFFKEIISEYPKADWTGHSISMAGILAGLMGEIVDNPEDEKAPQKIQTIIALRRSLGLHSSAKGRLADNTRRKKLGLEKEKEFEESFEDDLIARPH